MSVDGHQSGSMTPIFTWSPESASDDAQMPRTPSGFSDGSYNWSRRNSQKDPEVIKETSVKVLILGAGPTGLGAAHQLHNKGSSDWLIIDSMNRPGGMAITEKDEHGFRWDLGGHVIHSHYEAFDKAIAHHKDWVHPNRGGWVRVQKQWCPTPIQQSLGNLRNGEQITRELETIRDDYEDANNATASSSNLAEYYRNNFGETLNKTFFEPFNRKQWAWDLNQLDHTWTSLRAGSGVANVPQAVRALVKMDQPKDTSAFPYPRLGTGSLWQSIASTLPSENQRYSTTVEHLDINARKAYLSNGEVIKYSRCISSIPLNKLIEMIGDQRPDLAALQPQLKHSSTTAVGLGFTGELPSVLKGKSWIFSADPEVSFHRATVLTNFSSSLSNDGSSAEPRWSIMFETSSSSQYRPVKVDQESLVADHLAELTRWGAIEEGKQPLSVWYKHLHMGYPLPFKGRDSLLSSQNDQVLLPALEEYGILSRGRFGGWRYESSNQDYAFVQGIEAVDVITAGKVESAYWSSRPDQVKLECINLEKDSAPQQNAKKQMDDSHIINALLISNSA